MARPLGEAVRDIDRALAHLGTDGTAVALAAELASRLEKGT